MISADKDDSHITKKEKIHNKQPIQPRDVYAYTNSIRPKKDYSMQDAFEEGLSVKTMLWLRLPWIVSTAIMFASIITYFAVHNWNHEVFTETVLGIIIGGSATNAGITILNLHKNPN